MQDVVVCGCKDAEGFPGDGQLTVVAVLKPVIRHGLDRLLHLLGQHGKVCLETDPDRLTALLQSGAVGLLLSDRALLASLEATQFNAPAVKVALVSETDFPALDWNVEQWSLCAMLPIMDSTERALELLQQLLECANQASTPNPCQGCRMKQTLMRQPLPLSPRELGVFCAIAQGDGPSEIARKSGLSVKTVEAYRERIKLKLGLDGREALMLAARMWVRGFTLDQASTAPCDRVR